MIFTFSGDSRILSMKKLCAITKALEGAEARGANRTLWRVYDKSVINLLCVI